MSKIPFAFSAYNTDMASVHYWAGEKIPEMQEIKVGSPEWWEWLETGQSFSMNFSGKGHLGVSTQIAFTVRPEKRSAGGIYWTAWKTINNKTYKKYLGPSKKIDKAVLDQAGVWFIDQQQAEESKRPENILYKQVIKLEYLVEDLIGSCKDEKLKQRAVETIANTRKEREQ